MTNPDRTAQNEPRFIALLDLPTPALPISQRLARRLRFERRVPSYKVGGRVLFDEADLRDFINAGRTEAR
jgi:hypothetical protein